jgi:hypothetical protein|tara:strand:- start:1671 stop:3155 length:1485 start_codon:yes stop_codon:yes gene_type:complete
MTTVTPEQAATTVERFRADPVFFFHEVLGRPLFPKQQEMALSVARNRRTSVVGANSSGKDYTSGGIVLWWLQCWSEAKVIVTGPTYRQVSDIIWREARRAYNWASADLGGLMYDRDPRYEITDERYAQGFSTDKPWNVQGFHSPHLLVIVTEAHAMPQDAIEALKRLNPERLLLTGNPLALGGEFYDSFHGNRELYKTVKIAAIDTPNIDTIDPETGFATGRQVVPGMLTAEDVTERAKEYGVGSPMYVASILAEFPANLEESIVTLVQAEAAVALTIPLSGDFAVLGVDVARYGTDKTVMYRRQDRVARKVYEAQGRSLMAIVGRIMELIAADPTIKVVVVDDTGIGGGVTDRLKELRPRNVKIMPFIGGSRARMPRFFNRIAECWWRMRQAFQDGNLDIEEDRALISQVTTRRYQLRSDRVIQLERKEEMRKRGGKSPDEADALAMTYSVTGIRQSESRDRVGGIIKRHPLGLDTNDSRYTDTDTGKMPGGY